MKRLIPLFVMIGVVSACGEDAAVRPAEPAAASSSVAAATTTAATAAATTSVVAETTAAPADTALPDTAPDDSAVADSAAPDTAVAVQAVVRSGVFGPLDHDVVGAASVTIEADGAQRLDFGDDFSSESGPRLVVLLSAAGVDSNSGWDDTSVVLGALKNQRGAQTYEIPAEVDLSQYRSVVIWCDEFDVGFGVAGLA